MSIYTTVMQINFHYDNEKPTNMAIAYILDLSVTSSAEVLCNIVCTKNYGVFGSKEHIPSPRHVYNIRYGCNSHWCGKWKMSIYIPGLYPPLKGGNQGWLTLRFQPHCHCWGASESKIVCQCCDGDHLVSSTASDYSDPTNFHLIFYFFLVLAC